MWNDDPEIELAPKPVPQPSSGPAPSGSNAAARCPANHSPTTWLSVVVWKVMSTWTLLLPQFWKQEVAGTWVTLVTLAAEAPPTRMKRDVGVSLLLTPLKASDGMAAANALENKLLQVAVSTSPLGRSAHAFNRAAVVCGASSILVRKS